MRDLLTLRMGFGVLMRPPGATPIPCAADALALGQGPPNPMAFPPPDEWMRRFGMLPLILQPGEQWIYNTGANVLGVLLARASASSFPDFLAQRLFEPLGMKDTALQKPPWGNQSGYVATQGWGLGMSVVTQMSDYSGTVGTFGWDGGFGTSWYCGPRESMIRILMTQAMWTPPDGTPVSSDFAVTAYQAIDD